VAASAKHAEMMELKLFRLSPLGPIGTTTVIGVVIFGLFLLNVWATEDFAAYIAEPMGQNMLRVGLMLTLILCAALGVSYFADHANQADTEDMQREFGLAIPLTPRGGPGLMWATIGGLIVGIIFLAFIIWSNTGGNVLAFASSIGLWFMPVTPLLWVMMARGVYDSVVSGRHMSNLIQNELVIDLYHHHELTLFGRIAMRGAFIWLIFVGLILLGVAGDGSTLFAQSTLAIAIAIATFNFVSTMQPIRRRISAAKDAELKIIRERLAQARMNMESSGPGTDVPALIALEDRIEKIREWPLDLPTAARLPLYILIPVVTWVIGVYAEVLLQQFL